MDDLLMAVGATSMRWRGPKDEPKVTKEPENCQLKLVELAFRMGQSSAAGSTGSATPVDNLKPSFPALPVAATPVPPVSDMPSVKDNCLGCLSK